MDEVMRSSDVKKQIDKTFFKEETVKREYDEFLHRSVRTLMSHFKEDDGATYDTSYVLKYLLQRFNFSCIYGTYDIGLKDNDKKELFCRRQLDIFPTFYTSIDDVKEVRESYADFFLEFCCAYRKYCLGRYVKYMKIAVSQDMFDKWDSMQKL